MSARQPNIERNERIVAMRERGLSYRKIADELGVSEGTVSFACLKLAVDPPNAKPIDPTIRGPLVVMRGGKPVRRFLPEEDALLLRLAVEGKGNSAIGKALGRQPNSVGARLMILARREERAQP